MLRPKRFMTAAALIGATTMLVGLGGEPVRAASTTSAPSCGSAIYKGLFRPWKCTFADDFNGTSLDTSKWVAQQTAGSAFTSGKDCFVDSPNNVAVGGGVLSLTVRRESAPFVCSMPGGKSFNTDVTAGSVSTFNRFTQTYGRFEIRAAFPGVKVSGVHSALWMWPATLQEAWPASGEIDIAEYYSKYPDRAIPYLHYLPTKYDANATNNYCLINDPSTFHTYLLEWSASSIEIKYDGKTCLKNTNWSPYGKKHPYPFNSPFMVALTQGLGSTGNDYVAGGTPLPATMKVDFVKVWS